MRYRSSRRTWTFLLMASLTGCNFAERRSENPHQATCATKPTGQVVPDCTSKTSSTAVVDRATQKPLGVNSTVPSNGITVLPRVMLRASKCLPCETPIQNATVSEALVAPPTSPPSDVPIPPTKVQTAPAIPDTKTPVPPVPKVETPKAEVPKPKTLPEQKPVEPTLPKVEPKPEPKKLPESKPVEPKPVEPKPVAPQPKPVEPLKLNADKLPPLGANINRSPDFQWATGVVSYSYITRAWHLRYAPIDAADEFGGSITLIGSEYAYQDGERVRVEGELISRAHASAPPYRVRKIERLGGE
jgi:hypothetical protein